MFFFGFALTLLHYCKVQTDVQTMRIFKVFQLYFILKFIYFRENFFSFFITKLHNLYFLGCPSFTKKFLGVLLDVSALWFFLKSTTSIPDTFLARGWRQLDCCSEMKGVFSWTWISIVVTLTAYKYLEYWPELKRTLCWLGYTKIVLLDDVKTKQNPKAWSRPIFKRFYEL